MKKKHCASLLLPLVMTAPALPPVNAQDFPAKPIRIIASPPGGANNFLAAIVREIESKPGRAMSVDLPAQTVVTPGGERHRFEIDPTRKEQLLKGLDDIGFTNQRDAELKRFEEEYFRRVPWLKPAAAR